MEYDLQTQNYLHLIAPAQNINIIFAANKFFFFVQNFRRFHRRRESSVACSSNNRSNKLSSRSFVQDCFLRPLNSSVPPPPTFFHYSPGGKKKIFFRSHRVASAKEDIGSPKMEITKIIYRGFSFAFFSFSRLYGLGFLYFTGPSSAVSKISKTLGCTYIFFLLFHTFLFPLFWFYFLISLSFDDYFYVSEVFRVLVYPTYSLLYPPRVHCERRVVCTQYMYMVYLLYKGYVYVWIRTSSSINEIFRG